MKKKIFVPLMVVAAVAMGYVGYGAYCSQSEDDALLLENVEALASDDLGSSGEIPRYINDTKIKNHKDIRFEIDSSGLKVEYSRTCSDVITYCKHTGEDEDICYERLNGVETTCGDWSK